MPDIDKLRHRVGQSGFSHILIILTVAVGLIIYLIISSTFPFKDKFFGFLYPKPSSYALSGPISGPVRTSPWPSTSTVPAPSPWPCPIVGAACVTLTPPVNSPHKSATGQAVIQDNKPSQSGLTQLKINGSVKGLDPETGYRAYLCKVKDNCSSSNLMMFTTDASGSGVIQKDAMVSSWTDPISAFISIKIVGGKCNTPSDACLSASISFSQASSLPSPSASSNISMTIQGAVAINNTNSLGANRFSAIACPGKPYITSPLLKVSNSSLGDAKWDCADPNFYFGANKGAAVSLKPGQQLFTITPLPGYTCQWYAVYDDRTSESYKNCTVTVNYAKSGKSFIWFFLNKTAANRPPDLNLSHSPYPWGYSFEYANASDPDKDPITLVMTGLPSGSIGPWCFGGGSYKYCYAYVKSNAYGTITATATDNKGGVTIKSVTFGIPPRPVPTPSPSPASKRVFVTSTTYKGGLDSYGNICQDRASAANLKGAWKIWLSVNNTPAKQILQEGYTYYLLNNKKVGTKSQILSGSLSNPINITELNTLTKSAYAWTGTDAKGDFIKNNYDYCRGWNWQFTNNDFGRVGRTNTTDGTWTDANVKVPCTNALALYCFEQ